ncbi:MAG: hypothetical protein ACLP8S_17355 [Solirubrobacteraceae bacterium]
MITSFVRKLPRLETVETALLRRSLDALSRACQRCGRCQRSPLIGERVYTYESGTTICELCRALERVQPVSSQVVHGPAFGQSIRILDHRNAHLPAT